MGTWGMDRVSVSVCVPAFQTAFHLFFGRSTRTFLGLKVCGAALSDSKCCIFLTGSSSPKRVFLQSVILLETASSNKPGVCASPSWTVRIFSSFLLLSLWKSLLKLIFTMNSPIIRSSMVSSWLYSGTVASDGACPGWELQMLWQCCVAGLTAPWGLCHFKSSFLTLRWWKNVL